MADQCNFCGSHKDIEQCVHCPTAACKGCRLNHEPYCEELQKHKRRGGGVTVGNVPAPAHRAGHEAPSTTEPDRRYSMPAVLGAPYLPENAVDLTLAQAFEQMANPKYLDADVVDAGLEAVKDLLAE